MFNAGNMTMGAIIAIVMLAGRAMAPIGQLAFLITRGKQAIDDARFAAEDDGSRRRAAVGGAQHRARNPRRAHRAEPTSSFRYPEARARRAVSDVNLTIKPGERIGIIGRVASGKSTLGRVLCGLYAPTDGTYDRSTASTAASIHPHQLREAFRFVGQDAELFSGTVRDNLMLGAAQADDAQLIDAVVRSGADIFLSRDAAGFDLPVGERGSRLSGGQRALAGAGARAGHARASCCSSTSRPARWTPRPSSISSSI